MSRGAKGFVGGALLGLFCALTHAGWLAMVLLIFGVAFFADGEA